VLQSKFAGAANTMKSMMRNRGRANDGPTTPKASPSFFSSPFSSCEIPSQRERNTSHFACPVSPLAADRDDEATTTSHSSSTETSFDDFPQSISFLRTKPRKEFFPPWSFFVVQALFTLALLGAIGRYLQDTFPQIKQEEQSIVDFVQATETADKQNYQADEDSFREKKMDALFKTKTEQAQRMYRTMVFEKFGPGPHLVEFELNIWEKDKPVQHFFTVEMAPLDLMPASVHLFLEQVVRGYWSGTSFYLNTAHTLAAHPVSGNGQASRLPDMEEAGFSSLSVQEYSEAYPPIPYTLGFAGTGPSLYINKTVNRSNDPCFAQVVLGGETVDKMAALGRELEHPFSPIDIVSTKVVMFQDLSDSAKKEYMAAKTFREKMVKQFLMKRENL
jgi:hypothetical protein